MRSMYNQTKLLFDAVSALVALRENPDGSWCIPFPWERMIQNGNSFCCYSCAFKETYEKNKVANQRRGRAAGHPKSRAFWVGVPSATMTARAKRKMAEWFINSSAFSRAASSQGKWSCEHVNCETLNEMRMTLPTNNPRTLETFSTFSVHLLRNVATLRLRLQRPTTPLSAA